MKTKFLLGLLGVFALFGAGCSVSRPASETLPSATTTELSLPSAISTEPEPSVSTPESPSSTQTTVTIDDTWKTYQNKALGFEFKWPTKGKYAPEWEVKFLKETEVQDGCYPGDAESVEKKQITVNGVEFCVTSEMGAAAGSRYFSDYYVTKKDKTFILLQFKKRVVSGGPLGCSFELSASSSACIPFLEAEYRATLDAMISTFRYV